MNQPTSKEVKEIETRFINEQTTRLSNELSNMIIHKEYCSDKLNNVANALNKFSIEFETNTKDLKIDLEIFKEMNRVYDNTIAKIKNDIEEVKNKKLPNLKVENLEEDIKKQI